IVAREIADIAAGKVHERELTRAKENLKGRIVLSMESTSSRMSRLGKSLITDTELLTLDRIIAEIDAVEPSGLSELAAMLLAPDALSASGIGPNEDRFLGAVEQIHPGLTELAGACKLRGSGRAGKSAPSWPPVSRKPATRSCRSPSAIRWRSTAATSRST